jgi:lipopolysaccharide/colanic/teichoic acid biosynthesis glycosyltransferase
VNLIIKYCFDRTTAFFGILILSPLLITISLYILFTMSFPIIFKQKRIGLYGEPFILYKFRTMDNTTYENTVSIKDDHRVTRHGSFLRKYKLDELPELWNVLKGDMSFVGPRPDVPGYADRLEGEDRKLLLMRPGITGPASLRFINEEELLANVEDPQKYNDEVIYPAKVKLNLQYYQNISLWKDIKIICKTVFGMKD